MSIDYFIIESRKNNMLLLLTSTLPFLAHDHASAVAFLTCRSHNYHGSIIPEFLSDEERVDWYQKVANDEELYTELQNNAFKRGLTIGVIDGFTAGATGVTASQIRKNMAKSRASAYTKPAVVAGVAAAGAEEAGAEEFLEK